MLYLRVFFPFVDVINNGSFYWVCLLPAPVAMPSIHMVIFSHCNKS